MSISTPPSLSARSRNRAGRWRTGQVPNYNNDQRQAYAIDERVKQLGRWERYNDELSRIAKVKNLPPEWANARAEQ
jgi:hypothetical protein